MPEYTPPQGDEINFELEEYTVPQGDAVNFDLAGEKDKKVNFFKFF